jgi:hypothetical protein
MKTFNDFLRTEAGWRWCPREVHPRLIAAHIKSLAALERWTRERYPREYKSYSLFHDGTGCDVMRRLWSEYLRWKEQ